MFGYIRPFKPYMRYFEYEIYSSFYCGLCKTLGKSYGQIFRLMLSYDFTFLGVLDNAYHMRCNKIAKKHCIVHPFKKKNCLCCGENLDYTSAAAVISVYHKVCDEIADRSAVASLFFRGLRRIMNRSYRKAAEKYPVVAEKTEYYMKMQTEVEKEKCPSIDRACDPTAQIMSVIAENISDNPEDRKNLAGFGYHLGRFIYIADAYDDISKDKKSGNYNPLLLNFENINDAKEFAVSNINMSLAQASEFYTRLDISKFREILDNVVYLGLPNFNKFNRKEQKKFRNKITEI
ncbi:MAG: hypothetical protein IJA12_03125 [Oscillospiraceae bacterium]|nr:hypothetical protein [Oscillospiraceae bacterium]